MDVSELPLVSARPALTVNVQIGGGSAAGACAKAGPARKRGKYEMKTRVRPHGHARYPRAAALKLSACDSSGAPTMMRIIRRSGSAAPQSN